MGFDHYDRIGDAGDDAIPRRESPTLWVCAGRRFAQKCSAVSNGVPELRIAFGVYDIEPATDDADGPSVGHTERSAVRGGVDAKG